jgi:hypothetical protein
MLIIVNKSVSSNYETINPNPRKLSVIKNQSGPTVTRTAPPQQVREGNENRIVTFPHTLTFINNDAHYKEVKRTPMYVIHKLTFPDPQGDVIWASLKINVLPTYMSHKIKSDEPILYTVISGKFTVLIYEGYDEHSDTLYATEKIAIPPGVVHRFLNRLDDRNSVIVGEFPYDVIVTERSIAGKKEQEVIVRHHQPIDPHPTEENLVPEPVEESHPKSQPLPAADPEKPQKPTQKKTRTPPQK